MKLSKRGVIFIVISDFMLKMNGPADGSLDPANFDDVQDVVRFVKDALDLSQDELPSIGVICGSGLGLLAEQTANSKEIAYEAIPGFPSTTVIGHKGELAFGKIDNKNVVFMKGRFHPYEGHSFKKCALPIRVMRGLGAKVLILTSAVGGLNPEYQVGELVIIKDHIFTPGIAGRGPLCGHNDERLGPRFPSMTDLYTRKYRQLAHEVGEELDVQLHEGVYGMNIGPQFETPAELNMFRILGADVVGMSVCHETIAARHLGMDVLCISLISNVCELDINTRKNSHLHQDVLQAAQKATPATTKLVREIISRI